MPDPSRHSENRNVVERILNYIPGFHGYLQKEYRRESDQLARNWMADKLQQSKRGLDDYMRALVDKGQIDGLPLCDRLKSRLDTLRSRMKGDVQGYSGFFDFVRIGEQELDEVYNLDMSLMEEVESLAGDIKTVASSSDGPQSIIPKLQQQLDDVEQTYNQRGDLLKGLVPEGE